MTIEEAKKLKPGSKIFRQGMSATLKSFCRIFKYDRDENYEQAVIQYDKTGTISTAPIIDLHLTKKKEKK